MKSQKIHDLAGNCSEKSKRETSTRKTVRRGKALLITVVAAACVGRADVITTVGPNPFTGPPYYTDMQRLTPQAPGVPGAPYFFHDDQWAAIVFLRLQTCVPPDFNLLDSFDSTPAFPGGPPRVFLCGLTIKGHAIWKTGHRQLGMISRSRRTCKVWVRFPYGS